MFSGIVENIGLVNSIKRDNDRFKLEVDFSALAFSKLSIGESISVNGICLTIVKRNRNLVQFDVSAETMKVISGFKKNEYVNLECSLSLGDKISGHFVSGHIDDVGKVIKCEKIGDNIKLGISFPKKLKKYIVRKGSISINGISLTVNEVKENCFEVNIIPHTWSITNLKFIKCNEYVNLEVDMISRYIDGILGKDLS